MGAHIERVNGNVKFIFRGNLDKLGSAKVDDVKLSGNCPPRCGGRFAAIVLCVVVVPKIGLGGTLVGACWKRLVLGDGVGPSKRLMAPALTCCRGRGRTVEASEGAHVRLVVGDGVGPSKG